MGDDKSPTTTQNEVFIAYNFFFSLKLDSPHSQTLRRQTREKENHFSSLKNKTLRSISSFIVYLHFECMRLILFFISLLSAREWNEKNFLFIFPLKEKKGKWKDENLCLRVEP